MYEIKRVSSSVTGREGNMDTYISDEIKDILDTYRIKTKNVLNIIETVRDDVYHIVIYYKQKIKA